MRTHSKHDSKPAASGLRRGRLSSTISGNARPFVVPLVAIGYASAFWRSIRPLGFEASVFPKALIICFVVLAAFGVIEAILLTRKALRESISSQPSVGFESDSGNKSARVLLPWVTALATLLFVWAVPRAGFYESAALFMASLTFLLGYRRPVRLALLVFFSTIAMWIVFSVFFGLILPRGIITGLY